ncbi:MAG: hypothetical protein OWS03_09055 [Alicyclobacillaceae bacterium]|nr:hypothetical protein [Alicyclobacillaceae bacterium]
MEMDSTEYRLFQAIWSKNRKKRLPTARQYQAALKHPLPGTIRWLQKHPAPSLDRLSEQYGSFSEAVLDFLDNYYRQHPVPIPDYLLGWLTGRALITRKQDRPMLRFSERDPNQVRVLKRLMPDVSISSSSRKNDVKDMRSFHYGRIFTLKHLWEPDIKAAFRATPDFVRGYIEGHSILQKVNSNSAYRLILYGPLIESCRDYLISIGAVPTRIYLSSSGHRRWNLHQKSVAAIFPVLYPEGALCNLHFRSKIEGLVLKKN